MVPLNAKSECHTSALLGIWVMGLLRGLRRAAHTTVDAAGSTYKRFHRCGTCCDYTQFWFWLVRVTHTLSERRSLANHVCVGDELGSRASDYYASCDRRTRGCYDTFRATAPVLCCV